MTDDFEAPLAFTDQQVLPQWVDFNGHMNVAFYMVAFDRCVDELYNRLGVGPDSIRETNCSVFALEVHMNYLRELRQGDPLRVTGRLLDYDEKRIHAYFEMNHAHEGYLAAAMEYLSIHVDMESRGPTPFAVPCLRSLKRMSAAHLALPEPKYAGRLIGIRRD